MQDGWNLHRRCLPRRRRRLVRLPGAHRRHDRVGRLQHRRPRGRGGAAAASGGRRLRRRRVRPDEERGHDREGVRRAEARPRRRRGDDARAAGARQGDDRAVQVSARRRASSTRCRAPRPASCSASSCARSRRRRRHDVVANGEDRAVRALRPGRHRVLPALLRADAGGDRGLLPVRARDTVRAARQRGRHRDAGGVARRALARAVAAGRRAGDRRRRRADRQRVDRFRLRDELPRRAAHVGAHAAGADAARERPLDADRRAAARPPRSGTSSRSSRGPSSEDPAAARLGAPEGLRERRRRARHVRRDRRADRLERVAGVRERRLRRAGAAGARERRRGARARPAAVPSTSSG